MKKEKYILLVSRLFVNKWIQDFLYAIKDIDLKDWKVKIVGEWPYKSELEKIVNKNKIKNIEFLWRVDNKSQRMKELYGKASIFCQPSHFENASIVLLEAMQSGCALVARSVWWNPETVDNIWLFEDTNKLKDILNHFIDDERILKQTQHKNIQKVKSFEWKKIILEYNKVL
jgi:glycosyltransferase involved in cell wall biosynthesis